MLRTIIKTVTSGNTDTVFSLGDVYGEQGDVRVLKVIAQGAGATASLYISDGNQNVLLDASTAAGDQVSAENFVLTRDSIDSNNLSTSVDRIIVSATTADVTVYISIADNPNRA